ncbi:MAG: type II and III secretion system protein family protein [Rubripirellula sp.]
MHASFGRIRNWSRKDAFAMETTRLTAKIVAALLIVAMSSGASPRALAQSGPVRLTSNESTVSHNISQSVERLEMLVKSSRILTLEERIPKFQVHNEEVVGATPVSQNQIQVFAKAPGTTQLNLWDTNDKLYTVDVTVLADAREVEGILSSQLPLASLKVMPVQTSAIVSGTVTSVDDVDRAVAIVEQFYATVVNNIKVVGVQQVLLHTKIMEVSRTKLRDLGIDWGTFTDDAFFFSAPGRLIDVAQSTVNGDLPSTEGALSGTNRLFINGGDFSSFITALRKQDLIKFLAEPTVVATHGRPARFNVGGRVPYVVPTGNNSITVAFEEFGTSVDFLPFVVGPGRIRLEVRPEVTEPDESRSISAAGIDVPAFTQRYVETAVELQAGQTFAIAGLLQSRTESVTRATPFFGELPVIGAMFRRVREERNDIELLITVTPEIVDAMDPHQVPSGGPGLNSMSPNDKEFYIKGHIEVPNLLGDQCAIPGEGYSTMPIEGTYGGLPPGAIVPTDQPIMVGENVTISAPSE